MFQKRHDARAIVALASCQGNQSSLDGVDSHLCSVDAAILPTLGDTYNLSELIGGC